MAFTATTMACLALTATACDTPALHSTTATASARPTTAPALTVQTARSLITHYSQVNNQANTTDNAALLDTVEDGPLYAMSLGGYKQDSGTAAGDRSAYEPFSYDAATARLYIPRFASGVTKWFAAGVTITGTTDKRLIVFAEQPNHTWQLVYVADLDAAAFPAVALDADGYATAVAVDGMAQPAFDAGLLRVGTVDNFATGGKNSASEYFTPTAASKRQTDIHDTDTDRLGNQGTTVFAAANNIWTDAYGLKTASGALVLFSHTHTQTDTVYPGWQITPGNDTRAWLGDTPRQSITDTFVCNDAALAPVTGKAHLLGYTCELTGADGPPAP